MADVKPKPVKTAAAGAKKATKAPSKVAKPKKVRQPKKPRDPNAPKREKDPNAIRKKRVAPRSRSQAQIDRRLMKPKRLNRPRLVQLPSTELKIKVKSNGQREMFPTMMTFRKFQLNKLKKTVQRKEHLRRDQAAKLKAAAPDGKIVKVKKVRLTKKERQAKIAAKKQALKDLVAAGGTLPPRPTKNIKKVKKPVKKLPIYYPTVDKPKRRKTKKVRPVPKKIRDSIKPGTILILVAGRHRGKRVVFLKGLKSGLLLVTGPFQLNACPMRRICQKYVIATKTRLNISKIEIPTRIRDVYFRRRHPKRPKKDDGEIFEAEKETYKITEKRKQDQIMVDKQLLAVIKAHADKKMLFRYLAAPFSLRNKVYPHKLVF